MENNNKTMKQENIQIKLILKYNNKDMTFIQKFTSTKTMLEYLKNLSVYHKKYEVEVIYLDNVI